MAICRTPIESFKEKIELITESGCWIWTAYVGPKGYGVIGVGNKKLALAHRFSYEYFIGPIPDGLCLDHLCRVRCCVNPNHLEPVTNKENTRRGVNHNRDKTHCIHGHEFSVENIYPHPKRGTRHCKKCRDISNKKYKLNLRGCKNEQ